MTASTRRTVLIAHMLFFGFFGFRFALAEVVFDGSVGPPGSLSGNMVIPETQGTMVGNNLFHSFSTFNINTGERALFTGPASTSSIVSRVTGASSSTIDGVLDHNMPSASFWLLNPNGIIFGQNASLPTMGAFHASTADYVLLQDGGRFGADTSLPENTVLTVANPSAFGFIGSSPGSIAVQDSRLIVEDGTGLSLVGGDIDIRGGTTGQLVADSGEVNVVSVRSEGEAVIGKNGIDIDSFSQGGAISLRSDGVIRANDAFFGEPGAGSIYIRGGELVVEDSRISANTFEGASGDINIDVKQDIKLSDSTIGSTSFDIGDSPNIHLSAGGDVVSQSGSAISTSSEFSGDSGNITITAQNLSVESQSAITTTANSSGDAGDITINVADALSIEGDSTSVGSASLSILESGNAGNIAVTASVVNIRSGGLSTISGPLSFGAAGDLSIQADSLNLSNNGALSASTVGGGDGGRLSLRVRDKIFMTGQSQIASSTALLGDAGGISIETSELTLENQSLVTTITRGSGNAGDTHIAADRVKLSSSFVNAEASFGSTGQGGDVSITASESIELNSPPGEDINRARIASGTIGSGNGGGVTLSSPELFISNGAIDSTAFSSGNAGSINIDVDSLILSEGGIIGSEVSDVLIDTTGNGGTITINAHDSLTIQGDAEIFGTRVFSHISTETRAAGKAGDIIIIAPIVDMDVGFISASTSGSGAGGSVILADVKRLSLSSGALIAAATIATGEGGRVDIEADAIHILGVDVVDGARSGVVTSTTGSGHADNLVLRSNSVVLDQQGRLSSTASGTGDAGIITIGSAQSPIGDLMLAGESEISTSTSGLGDAGDIHINATGTVTLQADSPGPQLTSSAQGSDPNALGAAGSITLTADALRITGGGTIATDTQSNNGVPANINVSVNDLLIQGVKSSTLQAIAALENGQQPTVQVTGITSNSTSNLQGGSITLNVSNQASLFSGVISASASGAGGGGDILVGSNSAPVGLLSIDGNSAIFARAQLGNGGNIFIFPNAFLRDTSSLISADSALGNSGVVEIDRVDQDITGSILDLDNPLMESNELISHGCDVDRMRHRSSLTVDGQGGVRSSPGDYIPSKMSRISSDAQVIRNKAVSDKKGLSASTAVTYSLSAVNSNWGCNGRLFPN